MISVPRLYCDPGLRFAGDALRYTKPSSHEATVDTPPRPVVVWNCTRRCNLRCVHCYAASDAQVDPNELTTDEAKALIDDLADFGVPVLLFSGGEPLLRNDLFELLSHATARGLRTVLSTNGTRIGPGVAKQLAAGPVAYVGVSLDAACPERNDAFRGQAGAFAQALAGIRACQAEGIKVGVRFTMTRQNIDEIDGIFDRVEREGVGRVCFYHLVPAGRGQENGTNMPSHAQIRSALDTILARTRQLHQAGRNVEVLTVGNHADGAYLYLQLLRENSPRAEQALALLRRNGGNRSGSGIACVAWDGAVHPDQFWRTCVVGNIREASWSDLWSRPAEGSLLAQLRKRTPLLQGRCQHCRFLDICNGNLRVRAEAAGNGLWGHDPACYLTDEEIREESKSTHKLFFKESLEGATVNEEIRDEVEK